ncbi:DUF3850 domain-containing protein [Burkholderia gladioli]|uniref:DUF3850 domain-containing protein n=1 Tax=Burkholderia gladioli TaxID=28095 RepID=UPI001364BA18|nr:DUF3850 domain-containing protein [Burkholderia gladioli]KAF1065249.1 hypothetical protein LvStA_03924 [Burkholderia gladioli]WAG21343.1 DUF3850 domain-containing protein [Burkholderia gladioli]
MTNNTTAAALTERQRMDLLLVADDMSVSGDAKLADALRALLEYVDAAPAAPVAEPEHCQCPACIDGVIHDSCCAVHNEPAYPNGPCNCGATQAVAADGAQSWHHELKTDPDVFAAVLAGDKTHEIRYNDRSFKVGDTLRLRETRYSGESMKCQPDDYPLEYTGREITRVVSHVLDGYGLMPGWVVLSFASERAAVSPATADERAAFEAYMTRKGYVCKTLMGGYVSGNVSSKWDAWQAAWAIASQAAAPASKTLSCMQDEIAGVMQQHMEGNAGVVAIHTCALAVARHVIQQAAAPAEARDAIYQTGFMQGQWRDVDQTEYERAKALHPALGRIVYSAPADAGEAVAWIAVSDRLPPVRKTVIVAVEFDGPGDWRLKAGGINDDGEWCVFGASWTPTHWIEMPPSPVNRAQGAQGGKGGEA